LYAPFIPLEPDLGSRIAEPESILHKRLSRRDSGLCLVNHTTPAPCARLVHTIRGLRFPNDSPKTALNRLTWAAIRIDTRGYFWTGSSAGPLLHKTAGCRKTINSGFHYGVGINPYRNSDFWYFPNS